MKLQDLKQLYVFEKKEGRNQIMGNFTYFKFDKMLGLIFFFNFTSENGQLK